MSADVTGGVELGALIERISKLVGPSSSYRLKKVYSSMRIGLTQPVRETGRYQSWGYHDLLLKSQRPELAQDMRDLATMVRALPANAHRDAAARRLGQVMAAEQISDYGSSQIPPHPLSPAEMDALSRYRLSA